MSTTDQQLDIIACYTDLSRRTECMECDGSGEVRVATKTGSYPNSVGPDMRDKPCPEDCDDGWYTLREWGRKHGIGELLDHRSVKQQLVGNEMEELRDQLREVSA